MNMVKTIRLGRDELHTELIRLQGKIQSETGEITTLEDVIEILLLTYKMKNKKSKK
jgi:hypothetical protein